MSLEFCSLRGILSSEETPVIHQSLPFQSFQRLVGHPSIYLDAGFHVFFMSLSIFEAFLPIVLNYPLEGCALQDQVCPQER